MMAQSGYRTGIQMLDDGLTQIEHDGSVSFSIDEIKTLARFFDAIADAEDKAKAAAQN